MFTTQLLFFLEGPEGKRPVPKPWLDQFFMRDFTGERAFDETLPLADGLVEAGRSVAPEEAAARLEQWLRRRKQISESTCVRVHARARTPGA